MMSKNRRLIFDADGTFWDTLPIVYKSFYDSAKDLGYDPAKLDHFRKVHQTRDFIKLHKDLMINEDHVELIIENFKINFKKSKQPDLIPGAFETIKSAIKSVGIKEVFIVTNCPADLMKERLKFDNLNELIQKVHNPYEGKVKELLHLALEEPKKHIIYFGDSVGDGEECREAIKLGAKNLKFYAISHKYSFNTHELLEVFVNKNKDFAKLITSFEEMRKVWE